MNQQNCIVKDMIRRSNNITLPEIRRQISYRQHSKGICPDAGEFICISVVSLVNRLQNIEALVRSIIAG